MRKSAVGGGGLSPSLQQLRSCRHTFPSSDIKRSCPRAQGCITCKLAERVMKGIEKEHEVEESRRTHERDQRELVWAQAKRNTVLMRHPTNWTASLFQGALPNAEPEAYEPAKAASEGNTHSNGNSDHQRTKRAKEGKLELVQEETTEDLEEGKGVDGRPMLLPGTLLTLSCDCAHALMTFAEEVQEDPAEHDEQQERKALEVVAEAIAETEFVNRRDRPRTDVLVTKLQAAVRGWLARRLARTLILQGSCRRELDQASGAWQYVWPYRICQHSSSHPAAGLDGRSQRRGQDRSATIVSGEEFRSWYPPAMLKKQTLPSPRTATRRVEAERRKREARLALANSFLEDHNARLQVRETRSRLLLSLGELIRLVERALNSLKGASLDPPGSDKGRNKPPLKFSVRVLHPRGGVPSDAARAAAVDDTVAAWHRKERKVCKAVARTRAEKEGGRGKSSRSPSPKRGGSERRQRTGGARKLEHGGSGGSGNDALLPTTNDNLAYFEQRLLEGSSYETAASAVASLLRRRRIVGAIREGVRLGRNKDAWAAPGTSPVGVGVQLAPPWLRASQRFIILAHQGRLTAVSQASPHVFWATLASSDKDEVLKGLLTPFLDHANLLRAMFCMPSVNGTTGGTGTTVGGVEAHNVPLKRTENMLLGAGGEAGRGASGTASKSSDDNHNSQIVAGDLTTTETSSDVAISATMPDKNPVNGGGKEDAKDKGSSGLSTTTVSNTRGSGGKNDPETSGYRANLAPLACWKLDANAAARKDESVDLSFDSVAFDVVVDLSSQRLERSESENVDGTSVGDSEARHSFPTRALVTNAVPFRLGDGLPPDLTPLLFDSTIDAPVLAGREIKALFSDSGGERKHGEAVTDPNTKRRREQQAAGRDKHTPTKKETGGGSWTRRLDPLEVGEILSYRHRLNDGHTVEVRIRGDTVGPDMLARAGLPADLSKLVVGFDGGED